MLCAEVDKFIPAYVDGEFAEEDRVEFERHLAECARCREVARFEARFKASLRAHLRRPALPLGLRERITAQIEAAPVPGSRLRRFFYRSVLVAAAAPVLVALLFTGQAQTLPVVQESIHRHQRNLPLDVVGPDRQRVSTWFRDKVDFPVRPPGLRLVGADLLGGRVTNVRERQAALLQYNVRGRKVSVLVFEPGDLSLEAPRVRRIGNRTIYFDHQGLTNVAVFRDGPVGYAVTSDLPETEMVQVVSAALE
ncbi:MAG TPA: zf-HC2 domain-containing protein [Polyangia bacterium]|jgi:anti-sigma factor (TIGR02949 family)